MIMASSTGRAGIVGGRADNLKLCGLLSSPGRKAVAGCPSSLGTRRATGAPYGMKILRRWSRRGSAPATSGGSGRPAAISTPRCCGPGCGWSAAMTWRSTEALLLGREGRLGEPASLAGAWARLRGAAAPAAQAARPPGPGRPGGPVRAGRPGVPQPARGAGRPGRGARRPAAPDRGRRVPGQVRAARRRRVGRRAGGGRDGLRRAAVAGRCARRTADRPAGRPPGGRAAPGRGWPTWPAGSPRRSAAAR